MNIRQAVHLECAHHFTHEQSKWNRTYDMPFIIGPAFAAAGAAIGTAAAVGTAAAIGAAAVATVTAVAAVATVAGLAMTIVGVATGNKTLMKIGGIVGIAGGVTGLATSAVSAGMAAGAAGVSGVSAATDGVSAGAATAAESAGITSAAGNAATAPILSSPSMIALDSGTGAAAAGYGEGALSSGANALGSGAAAGATTATDLTSMGTGGMTNAINSAITPELSTNIGTDVGSNIGEVGAKTVANQSGDFFSQLTDPKTLVGIAQVAGPMLAGSAQQDINTQNTNKALDYKYADLALTKSQMDRQAMNGSAIGTLNMGTNAPTQAQIDAYNLQKAQQAKAQAAFLVSKPAGA